MASAIISPKIPAKGLISIAPYEMPGKSFFRMNTPLHCKANQRCPPVGRKIQYCKKHLTGLCQIYSGKSSCKKSV